MLHHPQGFAQGGLQISLLHQLAPIGQTGGIGHLVRRQGKAAAQHLGDGALHLLDGGLGLLLAGHGPQLPPLEGQGGCRGIEHLEGGVYHQGQTGGQKHRRLDQPVLGGSAPGTGGHLGEKRTDAVDNPVHLLMQQRHTAPHQQAELTIRAA